MKCFRTSNVALVGAFMLITSSLYSQKSAQVSVRNNSPIFLVVGLDGGYCCGITYYRLLPGTSATQKIGVVIDEPSLQTNSIEVKPLCKTFRGTCCPQRAYVHGGTWNYAMRQWEHGPVIRGPYPLKVPPSPGGDCENNRLVVTTGAGEEVRLSWEKMP